VLQLISKAEKFLEEKGKVMLGGGKKRGKGGRNKGREKTGGVKHLAQPAVKKEHIKKMGSPRG